MNKKNFKKVLDKITRNPGCWNQSHWHCGTEHCFAGWAQILSGAPQSNSNARFHARIFLGLSAKEADFLFDSKRKLADFKRFYEDSGLVKSFDVEGYDENGYNKYGFDRNGYDQEGFDKFSYDAKGFDRFGFDRNGFNKEGFDSEGFDRSGFDKQGFDCCGYDRDGFDVDGYDKDDLDRNFEPRD